MNRKQALSLVLRIGLSALMLGVLIWRIPPIEADEVVPELTLRTVGWLAVAMALTVVGLVLSALRWQRVLDVLGLHAGLRRLISHHLAGQFVSNVLPTTIGGDVLRVSRLSRETGESPKTFASVVLERLTGWLVLPVITFVGLLVNPPLQDLGRATQVSFSLACGTLVGLVLVLGGVAAKRLGEVDAEKGWKRFLAAVSLGLSRLRAHPRHAAIVLAVGFAYQLVLIASAVMAARALGIPDAGPTALLAFFPAVAIAQVLPISISGLGVREGLFALFLQPLGVATAEAVALGILLYLLNLVVSLLGAPAFAVGGRQRPGDDAIDPDTRVLPAPTDRPDGPDGPDRPDRPMGPAAPDDPTSIPA